jgi:cell wall-associated NlpC family hydrolase
MPKHRAPRYVRTKQVIAKAPVAAGATAIGLGVLSTSPANAAPLHDWSGVADCESSGNWSTNTGNGYFGGLQFSQSTWAAYGGTAVAARADLASPAQQVGVAEKVLAGQGVGAWPVCGRYLTAGSTPAAARQVAATPAPAAPAAPAATPAHADADRPAPTSSGRHAAPEDRYTVARGDTVATIAAAHDQGWRDLYQRNAGTIGANPDLIFPGQVLALTGTAAGAPAAPAAHAARTATPHSTATRTTATRATTVAPTTTARPSTTHRTTVAPAPVAAPPAPVAAAAAPVASAASSAGAVAEKVALAQVGRPYVSGGESPSGFDCSGLVQYAYRAAGVSLPRTTAGQISAGTPVSESNLQIGDLVFFYGGGHVGIYVGNGEVVHAPVPGQTVTTIKIAYMPFYAARHIG